MHDAKSADKGGNVVLDKDGRAKVLTDDSMGGAAAKYTWGQNESEVTIKVGKLPKGTKAKDVKLWTTSASIKLHVGGEQICAGSLHKPILADESTFVIEDEKAVADAGKGAGAAAGGAVTFCMRAAPRFIAALFLFGSPTRRGRVMGAGSPRRAG